MQGKATRLQARGGSSIKGPKDPGAAPTLSKGGLRYKRDTYREAMHPNLRGSVIEKRRANNK
tara:strand:- start:268 stop:453 length:186 start_codon:yes stop_codon:yes gene_type:complete